MINNTLIINELGNLIAMSVEVEVVDCTHYVIVEATGPTSVSYHRWTLKEAITLGRLLSEIKLPKLR